MVMTQENFFVNGKKVYLDSKNHWRFEGNNRLAPNPFSKRCKNCNGLVRSKKQDYCTNCINWTTTAHGSSILTNYDVMVLSNNFKTKSDMEIAQALLKKEHHKNTKLQSLLFALRHHRRKYLINRYTKKYYYKTIKSKYKKQHISCEICGWSEAGTDVHHVWQVKDFDDESNYHRVKNLISLCPNHHRYLEEMRSKNRSSYEKFMISQRGIEIMILDSVKIESSSLEKPVKYEKQEGKDIIVIEEYPNIIIETKNNEPPNIKQFNIK